MAKPPFDPDSIKDEPELSGGRLPQPVVDVDKFIMEIKGMLVGDEYEYAEETLRGVLKTVERSRQVTSDQARAIDNVASAADRKLAKHRGNWRWR